MLKLIKEIQVLGVSVPMYVDEDGVNLYPLPVIAIDLLKSDRASRLTGSIFPKPICRKIDEYGVDNFYDSPKTYVTIEQLKEIITRRRNTSTSIKKEILEKLCDISPGAIVLVNAAEIEFLDMLEQCIIGAFGIQKVIRQYKVGSYKLDAYLPDFNVAIEYDESGHENNTSRNDDNKRQIQIERELGCTFIRVSIKNSHLVNIGYVIKQLVLLNK